MKTTETQKQVINYLHELINNTFGAVAVPLHLQNHIKSAASAVGLCVCSGAYDAQDKTIVLYID